MGGWPFIYHAIYMKKHLVQEVINSSILPLMSGERRAGTHFSTGDRINILMLFLWRTNYVPYASILQYLKGLL